MQDDSAADHSDADHSDAVQAGLEQFQRAALDAVRAARMMLEAAESLLEEPEAARTVADTVTAFARTATETVAGFAAAAWPPSPAQGAGTGASDRGGPDDEPDGGFERIPVD